MKILDAEFTGILESLSQEMTRMNFPKVAESLTLQLDTSAIFQVVKQTLDQFAQQSTALRIAIEGISKSHITALKTLTESTNRLLNDPKFKEESKRFNFFITDQEHLRKLERRYQGISRSTEWVGDFIARKLRELLAQYWAGLQLEFGAQRYSWKKFLVMLGIYRTSRDLFTTLPLPPPLEYRPQISPNAPAL